MIGEYGRSFLGFDRSAYFGIPSLLMWGPAAAPTKPRQFLALEFITSGETFVEEKPRHP